MTLYYDPTLATFISIAAFGWIGTLVMSVVVYRNWGKGKRRR